MDIRPLGRSGLSTPPLVLGGNVFGFTVKGEEAFRVLDRFVAAGGRMIDTADTYSVWVPGHVGGESETLIGEWLKRSGRRDEVLIATKVGNDGQGLGQSRIADSIEGSLRRLRTDRVDLYYAHKDDPDTPIEHVLSEFDRLVRDGKVRALGASNFSADRLRASLDFSEKAGLARYEVLQPEYNLMARDEYEGDLQKLCMEREIGVLPYFGLASGFLTGKYRSEADFSKSPRGAGMARYLNDKGYRVLDALDSIAAETGASQAQIALAWISGQPGVTAPIASATGTGQLEELLGAMTLKLSAEQSERLTAASA